MAFRSIIVPILCTERPTSDTDQPLACGHTVSIAACIGPSKVERGAVYVCSICKKPLACIVPSTRSVKQDSELII